MVCTQIDSLQAQLRHISTEGAAGTANSMGSSASDEESQTVQELRVCEAIYQSSMDFGENADGGLVPSPVLAALPVLVQRGAIKMRPFNRVIDAVTSCVRVCIDARAMSSTSTNVLLCMTFRCLAPIAIHCASGWPPVLASTPSCIVLGLDLLAISSRMASHSLQQHHLLVLERVDASISSIN
jgi:hypothetical protein